MEEQSVSVTPDAILDVFVLVQAGMPVSSNKIDEAMKQLVEYQQHHNLLMLVREQYRNLNHDIEDMPHEIQDAVWGDA